MIDVISVRFRGGCKAYYFNPGDLTVAPGDDVIVETTSGAEYGHCVEGNHPVDERQLIKPLRPVLRLATDGDRRTDLRNRAREREAFAVCEKKIAAHKLEMKLIRVECNFEGSKMVFFFTAEGRVDFRELVKDLASVFRARIELRQVGVRDEAKMLGGLGICGRPLCCSQFLDQFVPVSIKMAKTQNLSLNPTKISGTCGRLMCCLKYEQNAYEDAMKRVPKNDSFVNTPDGPGNVCSVDLLREEAKVRLDENPENPRTYKAQELDVLRSGKGSREGIVVPRERPARYVPDLPEEESQPADRFGILYDFTEEAAGEDPVREKTGRGSRRRRSRGKSRGTEAAAAGQERARQEKSRPDKQDKPEKAQQQDKSRQEKSEQPGERRRRDRRGKAERQEKQGEPVEKIQVRPTGDSTAEKKAAADRRAKTAAPQGEEQKPAGSGEKSRRRRPRRRGKGSGEKSGGEGAGS